MEKIKEFFKQYNLGANYTDDDWNAISAFIDDLYLKFTETQALKLIHDIFVHNEILGGLTDGRKG